MFNEATVFLISLCFSRNPEVSGHLLIHTNVGWIKGKSVFDGNYTAFMGIPYGMLNQRNIFYDSVRYPHFEQTFNALNDGIACHQVINEKVVGTSDCLVLNIYVPKAATVHNKVPVMVWFHPGGDFANGFAGKSNWGPKYLVRHNVIVITVNYRLGIFGFMCLDIPEVPGNQGLKDQVLALKWIQENIYWFGGDVERVTLFGNADSSRGVDMHLLSTNRKMFNNVILQSGTALDASWLTEKNNRAPVQIVQKLGHITNDTREALKMMAAVEPAVVLLVAYELGLEFKPCVEKQQIIGVENLITDYPVNLHARKVNGMSIMIGVTSNEAAISYELLPPDMFKTLNIFADRIAGSYDLDRDTFEQLVKLVREFYIGDGPISYKNRQGVINFESDFFNVRSAETTMRKYLDNNAEKVYFYVFSYNGRRNYAKAAANVTIPGASQGDELGYLFDMKMLTEPVNMVDHFIIDKITAMWANFARTNDPTPNGSDSDTMGMNWTPVTQGSKFYYMDINKEFKLKTRPFDQRLDFWNLLHLAFRNYQKGYREIDNEELFKAGRSLKKSSMKKPRRTNAIAVETSDSNLMPTCVLQFVKKDTVM